MMVTCININLCVKRSLRHAGLHPDAHCGT
jgi:hypothetical protein